MTGAAEFPTHNIAAMVISLSDLLKTRFVYPNPRGNSVLDQEISHIFELHNKTDFLGRDMQLTRMLRFTRDLQLISKSNDLLFREFRKKLRKAKDRDSHYGLRFEVYTAASLFRKNIKFTKSETPDFKIFPAIKIECGSARTDKPTSIDITQKLRRVILKKNGYHFVDDCTAIFIEITNLVYAALQNVTQATREAAADIVHKEGRAGSFVFFFTIFHSNGDLETSFWRIDRAEIDPSLSKFLDTHYHTNTPRRISHYSTFREA